MLFDQSTGYAMDLKDIVDLISFISCFIGAFFIAAFLFKRILPSEMTKKKLAVFTLIWIVFFSFFEFLMFYLLEYVFAHHACY